MTIALVSFFHSANLGDLLIARTLLGACEKHSATVPLNYGANPRVMTDIESVAVTSTAVATRGFRDTAIRVAYRLGVHRIRRLVKRPTESVWSEDEAAREIIREADLLVIGGGNMIFDVRSWTRSWERFAAVVDIAKDAGVPVFGACIGIGPFATFQQQRGAAAVLAKCDALTFRDRASLELYRQASARPNDGYLTVDPVFNLPRLSEGAGPQSAVGINLIDTRLAGAGVRRFRRHRSSYVQLILRLLEQLPHEIVLFSTDLSDLPMLYDVCDRVNSSRCRVRNVGGLSELIDLYGHLNLVLAARMHTLITAYTQEIPVIGISWQPKVRAFFEIISDPGSVFSIDSLGVSIDDIVEQVIVTLRDDEKEEPHPVGRLSLIRERLEINDRIIEKLLGSV